MQRTGMHVVVTHTEITLLKVVARHPVDQVSGIVEPLQMQVALI
jgi:hypothetical protein